MVWFLLACAVTPAPDDSGTADSDTEDTACPEGQRLCEGGCLPTTECCGCEGGTCDSGACLCDQGRLPIALSPAPELALSAENYALGDHATGLSARNMPGTVNSPATGDTIDEGIAYDPATRTLTYAFGYGSDHGFVDLDGAYTMAHIHGPVAVQYPEPNVGAGNTIVGINDAHTAGTSAYTGTFRGSYVLSETEAGELLANLYYFKVHSDLHTVGEIRGHLVPVHSGLRCADGADCGDMTCTCGVDDGCHLDLPHVASARCTDEGACALTCDVGFTDANGDYTDGCEQ